MSRGPRALAASLFFCLMLPAQQKPKDETVPPEEDEALKAEHYDFNPLRAERELQIGKYYFKKGDYRGAARRYEEAAKWNAGFAEAYLRLGEAREKQKDMNAAREAYAKYLDLAPDAKNAGEIRKKINRGRGAASAAQQ